MPIVSMMSTQIKKNQCMHLMIKTILIRPSSSSDYFYQHYVFHFPTFSLFISTERLFTTERYRLISLRPCNTSAKAEYRRKKRQIPISVNSTKRLLHEYEHFHVHLLHPMSIVYSVLVRSHSHPSFILLNYFSRKKNFHYTFKVVCLNANDLGKHPTKLSWIFSSFFQHFTCSPNNSYKQMSVLYVYKSIICTRITNTYCRQIAMSPWPWV